MLSWHHPFASASCTKLNDKTDFSVSQQKWWLWSLMTSWSRNANRQFLAMVFWIWISRLYTQNIYQDGYVLSGLGQARERKIDILHTTHVLCCPRASAQSKCNNSCASAWCMNMKMKISMNIILWDSIQIVCVKWINMIGSLEFAHVQKWDVVESYFTAMWTDATSSWFFGWLLLTFEKILSLRNIE